ncbi:MULTISPECIES: TetR/AcrR family transcriptional regulator [unclassified Pseudofrankia]|uniref:TetR/AcrR family transcriptional regulator n=1 Tax=unclassified Pseudofrankia TaxID=2994372 RepID=UPI000AE6F058|nr:MULTISPECIES: TetR/AcrR family transcriptional regulator [unclassified Pseudofrankia]MDT3442952.1 TetR/AcrR family transcriptional regulator [Pseudofrankia sp. BMG5.37]
MTDHTPSRRDRLRAETSAEIKAIALKLMADGGPDAISLRAIAREMGMTAGAIYSYFATRDDLITALIGDVYTSAIQTLESARDAMPESDPGGRIMAWAQAIRAWALANPEGFRLIYGDPVPGYHAPDDGPAKDAELRACTGLIGLVAGAWPAAHALQPNDRQYIWTDFDPGLAAHVQTDFPDLPPAAVALALRVWGRMHGLMALEIYGHLRTLMHDPATVYRDEMRDLIASLGLMPPAPSQTPFH